MTKYQESATTELLRTLNGDRGEVEALIAAFDAWDSHAQRLAFEPNSEDANRVMTAMMTIATSIDGVLRGLGETDQSISELERLEASLRAIEQPEFAEFIRRYLTDRQLDRTDSIDPQSGIDSEPVAVSQDELDAMRAVASSESTLESTLAQLAHHPDKEVRRLVANNPRTTSAVQLDLAQLQEASISLALVNRQTIDAQLSWTLSCDPNSTVRRILGYRGDAPTDVLSKLSNDDSLEVLVAVAENPNTDPSVLIGLAQRDNSSIRMAIARSGRGPDEALRFITLKESSERYRRLIAQSPAASPETLSLLIDTDDYETRRLVSLHPNTTSEQLVLLGHDRDASVRTAVGVRAETPSSTLEDLSRDQDPIVRRAVALNPSAPDSILVDLVSDPVEWVRSAVLSRPDLKASVAMIAIIADPTLSINSDLMANVLKELENSGEGSDVESKSKQLSENEEDHT